MLRLSTEVNNFLIQNITNAAIKSGQDNSRLEKKSYKNVQLRDEQQRYGFTSKFDGWGNRMAQLSSSLTVSSLAAIFHSGLLGKNVSSMAEGLAECPQIDLSSGSR